MSRHVVSAYYTPPPIVQILPIPFIHRGSSHHHHPPTWSNDNGTTFPLDLHFWSPSAGAIRKPFLSEKFSWSLLAAFENKKQRNEIQ